MPIDVQCEACEVRFRVPDSLAGKRIRCRSCGAAVLIPAEAETRRPQRPASPLSAEPSSEPAIPSPARPATPFDAIPIPEPSAPVHPSSRPATPTEPPPPAASPLPSVTLPVPPPRRFQTRAAAGAVGIVLAVGLVVYLIVRLLPSKPVEEHDLTPMTAPQLPAPAPVLSTLQRPPRPANPAWETDLEAVAPPLIPVTLNIEVALPEAPLVPLGGRYTAISAGQNSPMAAVTSNYINHTFVGSGVIDVWNLSSGSKLLSYRGNPNLEGARLSPDGTMLAGWLKSSPDGVDQFQVLSLASALPAATFEAPAAGQHGVVRGFLPPGQVVTQQGGMFRVWDLKSSSQVHALGSGGEGTGVVALSPSGKVLVEAYSRELIAYDLVRGERLGRMELPRDVRGSGNSPVAIAFSPDSTRIALALGPREGAPPRRAAIIDAFYGVILQSFDLPPEPPADQRLETARLAFLPDNSALLCQSNLISADGGHPLCFIHKPEEPSLRDRGLMIQMPLDRTHLLGAFTSESAFTWRVLRLDPATGQTFP